MEIVIDISNKVYVLLKYFEEAMGLNDKKDSNEDVKTVLMRAVVNGTPLPKHHGRLIDADALEEYFRNVRKELKASDYKSGIEFFVRDEMLLNVQQFIHLCDAIIEGSDIDGR